MITLIKPVCNFIEQKLHSCLSFLERHYTWLSLIVIFGIGIIIIFVTTYLFRFNYYNFRFWKTRAITKAVYFGIILLAIKILLSGV